MKVLVACEESQRVCISFRELGHEAYSCDIQECSGGHPEWHIQDDVLNHLEGWDLIIAHPPCTYLSNAGARHLFKDGKLNQERYQNGLAAKEFFLTLYNAPCDKICIENPIPSKIYKLPKYTQIIEPYYFGEKYKKKSCLWLKGLPPLVPTLIINNPISTRKAVWFNKSLGEDRQKIRSKTFWGIARAMANQWGGVSDATT